ncbi:MAG TPA: hypothetical protein VFZ58_00550 [Candidatus Saccharimonadales bacterium]
MSVRRHKYLLFSLLSLLSFLIFWPHGLQAETLNVTATVPAPLPTQPAIITTPRDQQHFYNSMIAVESTCSNDTAYVELYRNDIFAGTTACLSGNANLVITILPGANSLRTRPLSSTGGEGPAASAITVYYDTLTPSSSPIASGSLQIRERVTPSFSPSLLLPNNWSQPVPFFITAKQFYTPHRVDEKLVWNVDVHGGMAPYELHAMWGDRLADTKRFHTNTVTLEHTYSNDGVYFLTIDVTDQTNNRAVLRLATIVQPREEQQTLDTRPPEHSPDPWATLLLTASVILTLAAFSLGYPIASQLLKNINTRHK